MLSIILHYLILFVLSSPVQFDRRSIESITQAVLKHVHQLSANANYTYYNKLPNSTRPYHASLLLTEGDADMLLLLVKLGGRAMANKYPTFKPSNDLYINAWSLVRKRGKDVKNAFALFYGLSSNEVEAVENWSIQSGCYQTFLQSALLKIPPFKGPVVRNTHLDDSSIRNLENSLASGKVLFINDFVKSYCGGAMATAPIGYDLMAYCFRTRPFRLVIMSKTGRYICPIKHFWYQAEPEVLFLNSIAQGGFVVLGKSITERRTYYYLKEL